MDQLTNVQRAPQRRLRTQQSTLNNLSGALSNLASELENLKSKATALTSAGLYESRLASSGNTDVATATAGTTATLGNYDISVTQLATSASLLGGANIGRAVDADANLTTKGAGFGVTVTEGHFTVNGEQIEIGAEDSLNDVLAKIGTQTGLTASYDSNADRVSISDSAGNPVVLGSASDTSNFLQAARLSNNGTASVASSFNLGALDSTATLNSARFNDTIASGTFSINGVEFTVDAATDTLGDVISAINNSAAGVTASYDSVNDQLSLRNKVTGDIGFSVSEGSSNFLQATGLLSGSGAVLQEGRNALFSINGGSSLSSLSNTLNSDSHGIEGLAIHILDEGSASVTIENDSEGLTNAITDFVDQYNKVQNLVQIQTTSSTDSDGAVTSGVLAGNLQVAETSRTLRNLMASSLESVSGLTKRLESLGFKSDGYSDQFVLSDSSALESAVRNAPNEIQKLFSDEGEGIATRVNSYLNHAVGTDGSFVRHRETIARQSSRIDEQVSTLEKAVLANRERMFASFLAMESALSQINTQARFVAQRFG